MKVLKSILKTLDLEDERVEVRWISAAEGKKFADTATELDERIREMGPNPMGRQPYI